MASLRLSRRQLLAAPAVSLLARAAGAADLLAAIESLEATEKPCGEDVPQGIPVVRRGDRLVWRHPTLGERWNYQLIDGANYKGLVYRDGNMWPVQPQQFGRESPEAADSQDGYYPLNPHNWSFEGNWNPSRNRMINHLWMHPNHRGKFDYQWLQSLDDRELESLHDDDHEGRVQWEFVVRLCPT